MGSVLSGLRIIELTTSLIFGSARMFLRYCHAVRSLGAEVEAWVFEEGGSLLEELADDGFATRTLGLSKHTRRFSPSRALTSALADSAPDWVHAHSYEMGVHASRAKVAGAVNGLVITHHDARLRWSRRIIGWPYRRVPDIVTAPSPSCAKRIASWYGYPLDRVMALPYYRSEANFSLPPNNEALAEQLGLSDAYPVIIWVGRLQRNKGHADLIRAFRSIIEYYPSARLVLVGDGKHGSRLQRLARDLQVAEKVVFTGYRNDVPALLALADVFACPSHAECSCVAVQEAMAAGKCIVSTVVGGPMDYVSDGESGLLVPIGRPEALADAILRVASDRDFARQLGQAARTAAQQHFSMERFVAGLEEVYAQAIGQQDLRGSRGQ